MSIVQFRKKIKHACARCGTAFTGYPAARYCSDKCRWRDANDRRKKSKKAVDTDK